MQAIEFNSHLEHGHIAVPNTLHLVEGQAVRVLILLDEATGKKTGPVGDANNMWERTAGAWQGEQLVREPQGEYEQRLDLE